MSKHFTGLKYHLCRDWEEVEEKALLNSDDTKRVFPDDFVAHNFPNYVSLKVDGRPLLLFEELTHEYAVCIFVSPEFLPWCKSQNVRPKQTMDVLLCMHYEASTIAPEDDEEKWFENCISA